MGFDEIYARVPAEQIERLKEFRFTHNYKHLFVDGGEWEYISCGRGEQTLLLLPGGLSVGESTFPLITDFEKEYRIIAPSYALSLTMTGLCDGIAHILETENVNQAHVLGGSYGGLVAQYFVRKHLPAGASAHIQWRRACVFDSEAGRSFFNHQMFPR